MRENIDMNIAENRARIDFRALSDENGYPFGGYSENDAASVVKRRLFIPTTLIAMPIRYSNLISHNVRPQEWAQQIPIHSLMFIKNTDLEQTNVARRGDRPYKLMDHVHAITPAHMNYIMRERYIHAINIIDKFPNVPVDWTRVIEYCLDGWELRAVCDTPTITNQGKTITNTPRQMNAIVLGDTSVINYHASSVNVGDYLYLIAMFVPDRNVYKVGPNDTIVSSATRNPRYSDMLKLSENAKRLGRSGSYDISSILKNNEYDDDIKLLDRMLKYQDSMTPILEDFSKVYIDGVNITEEKGEEIVKSMEDTKIPEDYWICIAYYIVTKSTKVPLQLLYMIETILNAYDTNKYFSEHAKKFNLDLNILKDFNSEKIEVFIETVSVMNGEKRTIPKQITLSNGGIHDGDTNYKKMIEAYVLYAYLCKRLMTLLYMRKIGDNDTKKEYDAIIKFMKNLKWGWDVKCLKLRVVEKLAQFTQMSERDIQTMLDNYSPPDTHASKRHKSDDDVDYRPNDQEVSFMKQFILEGLHQPRRAWDENYHKTLMIPQLVAYNSRLPITHEKLLQTEFSDNNYTNTFFAIPLRYGVCTGVSKLISDPVYKTHPRNKYHGSENPITSTHCNVDDKYLIEVSFNCLDT